MDVELMDVGRTLTDPGTRPIEDAPPRSAPYETRAAWSERYVAWFIERVEPEGARPSDVPPTHEYTVEFNTCVLDPQEYERQTQAELISQTMH